MTMTETQAKAIFETYNPASDVRRCPNGRAKMRKPLDAYAVAAVNLYGIIRRDEFVEIFNAQNEEQTTSEEVYTILLPQVLKSAWYGFYKEYIVHYGVLDNFDWVDYLKSEQAGKPRYVPPKEQFLEFQYEDYEDHDHWWKVLDFMQDVFGARKNITEGFQELKAYLLHSLGMREVGPIMEKHNLVFRDKKQVDKFFALITLAKNNSRLWENKGHTPEEMLKLTSGKRSDEPVIHRPRKVGPNQPCPCGSGRKYKKCCASVEDSGAAQFAYNDRKLFYETWYKLMTFINQKLNVVDYEIIPRYDEYHDETMILKIRNRLWENPTLIGDFLKSSVTLSGEETALLQAMEKHHVKGSFILMKYAPDCAIFMSIDKNTTQRLYAVKGITDPIAKSLQRQLPVMLDTVLLPFGDTIIYDSFIITRAVSLGKGMQEMLQSEYTELKNNCGIMTKLP